MPVDIITLKRYNVPLLCTYACGHYNIITFRYYVVMPVDIITL